MYRCRQIGEIGGEEIREGNSRVITFMFSVNSDSVESRDVGDLEREENLKGVIDGEGSWIQL